MRLITVASTRVMWWRKEGEEREREADVDVDVDDDVQEWMELVMELMTEAGECINKLTGSMYTCGMILRGRTQQPSLE